MDLSSGNFQVSIEEKMKLGDVVIVHQRGLLIDTSLCIKLANFCKNGYKERGWTHSAMYTGDGNVIESFPDGIKVRKFSEAYLQGGYDFLILRHKNAAEEKLKSAVQFCMSEDGKKYDSRGIGYFVLVNLVPPQLHFLLGFDSIADRLHENGKFFCSELVSRGFEEAGVYCFEDKSYKIMPADFNNPLLFELIHQEELLQGNKAWRVIKDVFFCSLYFLIALGIYSLMVLLIYLIKKFIIGIIIVIFTVLIGLFQTIQKKHFNKNSNS